MTDETTTIDSSEIPACAIRNCRMLDKYVTAMQCITCEHFAGIRAVGDRPDAERRAAAGQPFWRRYHLGCRFPTFDSVIEVEL